MSFYCPDCGKDVTAPHFCDRTTQGGSGGIGFSIDLTKYIWPEEEQKKKPEIPEEYTNAQIELMRKFDEDEISLEEFETQLDYIENLIEIYKRLNDGKEQT